LSTANVEGVSCGEDEDGIVVEVVGAPELGGWDTCVAIAEERGGEREVDGDIEEVTEPDETSCCGRAEGIVHAK